MQYIQFSHELHSLSGKIAIHICHLILPAALPDSSGHAAGALFTYKTGSKQEYLHDILRDACRIINQVH